jgi:hypothetical protein
LNGRAFSSMLYHTNQRQKKDVRLNRVLRLKP